MSTVDTIRAQDVAGHRRRRVGTAALFVVGVTAFGSGAAAVGLGLDGPPNSTVLPPVWPPEWLFWAVWLVIYPASGIAAWRVWERRRVADVRGALAAFAIVNVASAMFLPVTTLTGGAPGAMTLMDLNGVVAIGILTWLFARYDRIAAYWMLPYLVWMPITSLLKIWLWSYN